jgi:methylthioribulose-1-phosphate dehydratase
MENLESKMSDADALKSAMVEVIHFLHSHGWAPATSSNYSFREGENDDFWISASGIDKGLFAASDFIHVDALGKPIDDARKTSAETALHVLIYECFPEAHCVLHSHSVYNTVLSMARKRKKMYVDLQGFEVLKGLKGIHTHDVKVRIPVFENSQDIEALAEEIGAWFEQHGEPQGFLLKGHGLYIWGDDIASAKRQMEVLEFLFEVVYKLKSL